MTKAKRSATAKKDDRFTYFAYGSNMLVKKLKQEHRCPSAKKINPSGGSQHMIKKHRFRFHKESTRSSLIESCPKLRLAEEEWMKIESENQNYIELSSGKGDAEETGNFNDVVYGVLFSIKNEELDQLDQEEGFGCGYDKKNIDVTDEKTNEERSAITYYATNIDPNLKPYHWYKRQTVKGARDNNLPEEYVKGIEDFPSKEDEDEERRRREERFLE